MNFRKFDKYIIVRKNANVNIFRKFVTIYL